MTSNTYHKFLVFAVCLSVGILLPACGPKYVEGPGIGRGVRIVKIMVEDLHAKDSAAHVITDRETIDDVGGLFSTSDWQKPDRRLVPSHRIQLFAESGESWTYWLGTFSDPPQFPCYWFCSGFWLAASDRDSQLDRSLYKPLATSGDMITVSRLRR